MKQQLSRQLSVRVPDDTYAEIEREAERERRKTSDFVRHLLADSMVERAGRLPPAFEAFVADVRTWLGGELGDELGQVFGQALRSIDLEGDRSRDTAAFMRACEWVLARRDKTVLERIEMVGRLRALKGRVVVNLAEFTGW